MKIVIAPDSFKGSLPAGEVAAAIEEGIRKVFPGAEVEKVPLADGGEGTARALVEATGGKIWDMEVTGPLGEKVRANYGILGDGKAAVVEMAAASAELRPNQRDEDALPPYSLLDPILKAYVEEDKSSEEIVAQGFNGELVKSIIHMVDSNEYKRRQGPPGVKITPRAFGKDRRFPITNAYRDF